MTFSRLKWVKGEISCHYRGTVYSLLSVCVYVVCSDRVPRKDVVSCWCCMIVACVNNTHNRVLGN